MYPTAKVRTFEAKRFATNQCDGLGFNLADVSCGLFALHELFRCGVAENNVSLCLGTHKPTWTKPLRGRWWCGSRVGLTDHPRCCFLAPSCTPLCESMEQLLTAADSISQRSIHDFSTTPHDRGHANSQLSSEYPKILCPTGLAIRAILPEVARIVGT